VEKIKEELDVYIKSHDFEVFVADETKINWEEEIR
jgi:hypothetical protein